MKIISVIALLFIELLSVAQGGDGDEKWALEKKTIDDLNVLLEEEICQNDSIALIHYRDIRALLQDLEYPKGEMTAYKHYGMMSYCQGKLDSMIFYQKKAALIAEKNNYHSFSGKMFSNLGYLFNNYGNYDSSFFYFGKALSSGTLAEDSLIISVAYTGLGINARELGQIDKSLEMYLRALSISESREDTVGMLTAKMNLLNFYRDHRPDLFLESELLEVIKMAKLIGQVQHEVSAYEYLGYLKSDGEELEEAFRFINKGLELNKSLKDNNRQISLLGALSYAHRKSGSYREAIKFSNEAIDYAISSDFTEYLPSLYSDNVLNYISLKEYKNAIVDGEKAVKIGEASESVDLYYKILPDIAFAYNELRQYSKAYKTQLLYSQLSEKIINSEKTEQLAEMQTKFETEKKETEIASLSQQASIQALEIRQKNQAIIIGVVVVLLALVALYFFYKQRETKKQQSQTELEQRFLRSQLNPHFISNALVAVQSFMLKNDSESAALYLTKFSKLMREILENSRKEFIPVEEEINMLKNFLDIHKLRLGSFDYSIELDHTIDPESDTMPPMFVQPFVENAVEHGIGDLKEGGRIDLKFRKEGDYISIGVIDNGKGLQKNENVDSTSLSTTIIQERMALFNRSLERKIQLMIADLKGEDGKVNGTQVQLKVPFRYV